MKDTLYATIKDNCLAIKLYKDKGHDDACPKLTDIIMEVINADIRQSATGQEETGEV